MNQEQGPSKSVFPSSLNEKGSTTFGITTEKPTETNTHFTDERRIAFEPPVRTVPVERPTIWDKEPPSKKSLIERLVNNLALRLVLVGAGVYGAGYAVNEVYQNIPAVRQNTDNVLERFGLKVIVPPTFDNKAENNVLGRNNSFYITPEEYKEKGPPTVEATVERNYVNLPFFIRFKDGKEHVVSLTRKNGGFEISGDLKGGELLVPAREDGEITGGGGSGGIPYLYKPGMIFQNFSSWEISLADETGGGINFILTTGALQTAKDLDLQKDKRGIDRGHIKGFAPIGTLLDDTPVFIGPNIILPNGKMDLIKRGTTNISTTPTEQGYVLK